MTITDWLKAVKYSEDWFKLAQIQKLLIINFFPPVAADEDDEPYCFQMSGSIYFSVRDWYKHFTKSQIQLFVSQNYLYILFFSIIKEYSFAGAE